MTARSRVFLNSEVYWSSLLTFFPVARHFRSKAPRVVVSKYGPPHPAVPSACVFGTKIALSCMDSLGRMWEYWAHLNPLAELTGTANQVAPMLRLHLPFPGGWYTAKSWIAPNVFMLPISRSTFPVPWRPSGTTVPASQPTSARRPDCWWYYKGEHWKSPGGQGGTVVTLSLLLFHVWPTWGTEQTPHTHEQCQRCTERP